jgi:hypothetical protein
MKVNCSTQLLCRGSSPLRPEGNRFPPISTDILKRRIDTADKNYFGFWPITKN